MKKIFKIIGFAFFLDLVIVRMGLSEDFDFNGFLNGIVGSLKK